MALMPRLLFRLTLALAGLLAVLVAAGPLLDREGLPEFVALFARDATVRRTAVASAAGLAVTAWVFFRPAGRGRTLPRKSRKPRRPPPTGAGA
jgi:hypothetical protein